ncbi:MAG: hypothetical protein QHJ82_05775 [Verrucomicrobiota bacterium]|nr:hypothetical protein [Verrucomicrobiota bacterium]
MQVKIINTACFGRPISGQYAIHPLGNAKMLDSTAVDFGIVKGLNWQRTVNCWLQVTVNSFAMEKRAGGAGTF